MSKLYPQLIECDSANTAEAQEYRKPADWSLDELNRRAGALVREALSK